MNELSEARRNFLGIMMYRRDADAFSTGVASWRQHFTRTYLSRLPGGKSVKFRVGVAEWRRVKERKNGLFRKHRYKRQLQRPSSTD